jgi:hypothetical protein
MPTPRSGDYQLPGGPTETPEQKKFQGKIFDAATMFIPGPGEIVAGKALAALPLGSLMLAARKSLQGSPVAKKFLDLLKETRPQTQEEVINAMNAAFPSSVKDLSGKVEVIKKGQKYHEDIAREMFPTRNIKPRDFVNEVVDNDTGEIIATAGHQVGDDFVDLDTYDDLFHRIVDLFDE